MMHQLIPPLIPYSYQSLTSMLQKTVRANHVPCMTKYLRKAIMKRSELETKYVKTKTPESYQIYKKQRNFCSKLYKKERKKYYNSFNVKNITDNKKF